MSKTALTDRKVQSLKAAPKGKRYQIMDTLVPGFGVRVTDTGARTYVLQARFPGPGMNPVRREIGKVGAITLEAARTKARDWSTLVKQGIDPAILEEQQRQRAAQARQTTFEAVAEHYITLKLATLRSGAKTAKRFRRRIIPIFKDLRGLGGEVKTLAEITDLDILGKLVNPVLRLSPSSARQLLNDTKTFLTWAADQRVYGITTSPAAAIKTGKVTGKIKRRQRVLTDIELRALWIAANRLPYPIGPLYRTLILTALRLREAANTSRPEWDLRSRIWIIPGDRMKGKLPHAVPIIDELREIAGFFPNGGPYLFSCDGGLKAMALTKIKQAIDEEMLKALREIAVQEGDDPAAVTLAHWTNHDIRRTVRTRLSRLKVPEDSREAVLAHVKPGVERTYDVHDYFDEKKEALEVWATELKRIAEPSPDNVVPMRRVQGR
jgi:integrase